MSRDLILCPRLLVGAGDDNNKISCLYRIGPLTGSPEILTPQRVVTISGGEAGGGGVEVV